MISQRQLTTLAATLIVATSLESTAYSSDAAQRGLEIAKMADDAQRGYVGESGTMSFELVNAQGDVTRRRITMQIMEMAHDGDRSRVTFEWPADVKGTKLLTWTHRQGDDEQWLYLPSIKRVKRISASNKSGSFMGSEFSYEDLSSQVVEKFTYKYIDEPNLGNRKTWRIERYPRDPNSGYRRQVLWLDKEYLAPLRIEYFDRKNELLKIASFEQYQRFGRYYRFNGVRVENVQTRKKSLARWEQHQVGQSVPERAFESSRLDD